VLDKHVNRYTPTYSNIIYLLKYSQDRNRSCRFLYYITLDTSRQQWHSRHVYHTFKSCFTATIIIICKPRNNEQATSSLLATVPSSIIIFERSHGLTDVPVPSLHLVIVYNLVSITTHDIAVQRRHLLRQALVVFVSSRSL